MGVGVRGEPPVVAIGAAAALWLVPESKDPKHSALDPIGAVLSIAGLSALVWGIIEAGGGHWGDPKVLAALGGGAALLPCSPAGSCAPPARCST